MFDLKLEKTILILVVFCFSFVSAQKQEINSGELTPENECNFRKRELKNIINECKNLKGKSSFTECTSKFKMKKMEYQKQCDSSNDVFCGTSFVTYYNDVCIPRNFNIDPCEVSTRNLGKEFFSLDLKNDFFCTNKQQFLSRNI